MQNKLQKIKMNKTNHNSKERNKKTKETNHIISRGETNINRKKIILILITISIIILIISIIMIIIKESKLIEEKSSVISKKLTIEEIKIAKYNTVIKLNNINFPSFQSNNIYNEQHLNSYYNFTYNFFLNINYTDFSPITLYSILINVYMAISDKEQLEILDNILGLNHDERIIFYSQIFKNNYFKNSEGEIKINNGAFYNSDRVIENKIFIEQLNKTYTECYKLSYKKDYNFIIDWINKSLKKQNLMNGKNLDNNENISILFLSTLYYQQKWKIKFVDSKTYKDIFHIDSNTNKEIYFMKHTYYVDEYYDYDNYISFYDYYSNNYLIQYLIPKLLNYNIL